MISFYVEPMPMMGNVTVLKLRAQFAQNQNVKTVVVHSPEPKSKRHALFDCSRDAFFTMSNGKYIFIPMNMFLCPPSCDGYFVIGVLFSSIKYDSEFILNMEKNPSTDNRPGQLMFKHDWKTHLKFRPLTCFEERAYCMGIGFRDRPGHNCMSTLVMTHKIIDGVMNERGSSIKCIFWARLEDSSIAEVESCNVDTLIETKWSESEWNFQNNRFQYTFPLSLFAFVPLYDNETDNVERVQRIVTHWGQDYFSTEKEVHLLVEMMPSPITQQARVAPAL